jgi:ribose transport system permease protein
VDNQITLSKRLETLPKSLWILLALFLVCSILVPQFFALSNFTNVLRVAAIIALAAYGQAIVIILSGIEFSVGSAVALGSIATVMVLQTSPLYMAFGAGFLTIVAIGSINGVLVAFFRLPPFLATLGMLMLAHGIASIAVGGLPVEAPVSEAFFWLGRGDVLGLPVPIILAIVDALALHTLLNRTTLGRSFYLIGANEEAAKLSGHAVQRNVWLGYTIAAAFVAIAGLILTSRVASAQPNLMPNLPFEAISACAIGGISLAGGRGSALQVVVGVLIIAIVNNAIVLLNLPASVQLATLGVVMVVAVLLQTKSGNLPSFVGVHFLRGNREAENLNER